MGLVCRRLGSPGGLGLSSRRALLRSGLLAQVLDQGDEVSDQCSEELRELHDHLWLDEDCGEGAGKQDDFDHLTDLAREGCLAGREQAGHEDSPAEELEHSEDELADAGVEEGVDSC